MTRHRIRALILVSVLALVVALFPVAVLAQDTGSGDDGFLLRVNGSVEIASQEVVDNVIVIGGDATVDGTVTGTLVVVGGDAFVSGTVLQDLTVVMGTLDLAPTALVDDVAVIRGELVREPGAVIAGSVTEGDYQVSFWNWGIFWAFMWAGMTLVVLTAGVVFAAIGGRQLKQAGDMMFGAPGPTLLGAVTAWMILPILMVPVLMTVVGVPLSIGYFLFVLPVVWFLGYLVAGTQLGRMILRSRADDGHPYLPAMLGLISLQLIAIVPVLGGMIALLAGVVGAGALVAFGWRAWQGPGKPAAATETPITAPEPVR